jgi:alcohol dehydrogenase
MKPFIFSTTKSIISEIGAVKRIAEICATLNMSKPLIVTDQGIVDIGLLKPLDTAFKEAGKEYVCFDQVVADPPEHIVLSAVTYAKDHEIDGVIGFGGGSSLDTAKLVALLANSEEQLADIYGVDAIRGKRLPLILIPTTAGTGSEVTPIAIVTTGATTKAGVVSAELLPDVALLDASLTLGLPPHVTAATGIDAMVHAIEAYTSAIKKNPYSDLLAKQALELLSNNIVEATFNGSNVEARQAMLLGACLAGQAFANAPVAAVHALAYPLGGHFHIPHGLSNALVLVQVMNFNLSHSANLYAELAPSISDSINLDGSNQDIAQALISFIKSLIKQLKLPVSLAEMGVGESDINTLANDAMLQTRLLVNNPKPVALEDVIHIYQQAHQGTD